MFLMPLEVVSFDMHAAEDQWKNNILNPKPCNRRLTLRQGNRIKTLWILLCFQLFQLSHPMNVCVGDPLATYGFPMKPSERR